MAMIKVKSDLAGTVSKVIVEVGSQVSEDDTLVVLESMKMEIPVVAPRSGRIAEIQVAEGETISEGDVMVLLDA
jgi:acetyl-CoA carboxylase biotin carboxyl carrier protein